MTRLGTSTVTMDDNDAPDNYPADGSVLVQYYPATERGIATMLAANPDDEDGRSEWLWIRLANGDLIFGCFPQAGTYFELEEDGLR
jgi:hypothetical protein